MYAAKLNRESVAIGHLERFVADYEYKSSHVSTPETAPSNHIKVAVIGSGPAGLAAAGDLAKYGYEVTVFEALHEFGGVLKYGIPEFRLPNYIIDREIKNLHKMGVKFERNIIVGKTLTMSDLEEEGFRAFFVGSGAGLPNFMNIPGENLNGVLSSNEYLTRVNLMGAAKPDHDTPVYKGRNVAVIGGGNTAIDCVRTLIRLGAEEVYIVYRRTRSEMPANNVEIEAAEHEGVKFVFLAAPVRVIADQNNLVSKLEYLRMELGEPDASGRRRPVPVKGSETCIDADMVISAIGQGPDVSFINDDEEIKELKITRWSTIDADPETLQTSIPYVFTAGDAFTGASLVIEAIGGGRRAARAIHLYLTGQEVTPVPKSLRKRYIPESLFTSVEGVVRSKRSPMPELPAGERIVSFVESDLVLNETDAIYESERCLNCCRLCYDKDTKEAA